ncbi:MAG TPA: hypothetical protein VEQ10_12920 [Vicinamibacteria bacterium]|nr:hypothetical protein [Vicinamibacteria bacterium]
MSAPPLPRRRLAPGKVAAAVVCAVALSAATTSADPPVSLFGGRLRLAGEVSGTLGSDDPGYFNYSDYAVSRLRLFRIDLSAELRIASAVAVLTDVRTDNLDTPRVYALFLRLTPWRERAVDLQAGLVPPVFGAFARQRYGYDDPLPSLPLVYQYLTILRYDSVPARAEDLVLRRGRGWEVAYPVGASDPETGLPVIAGERYDTGVQLRLGRAPVSAALALTQGSLSYPLVHDINGGKQVSARVAFTPGPALVVGVSAASGEWLSRDLVAVVPAGSSWPSGRRQDALGVDVQWSAGYWVLRGEAVWSRWGMPAIAETLITEPLPALGAFAEARYKIRPGLYAAARLEHLGFGSIDSALGRQTWEANVSRVEAGLGWTPLRHLLLKASWQHDQRDGGRVRRSDLFAGQALLWF